MGSLQSQESQGQEDGFLDLPFRMKLSHPREGILPSLKLSLYFFPIEIFEWCPHDASSFLADSIRLLSG